MDIRSSFIGLYLGMTLGKLAGEEKGLGYARVAGVAETEATHRRLGPTVDLGE